jgi:hypothetical protein
MCFWEAIGRWFRDLGRFVLSLRLEGNMSDNSCWNYSCGHEPSGETPVLSEFVYEHKYPRDFISALASPQLEDEAQLVMDRLMRECLKRKPLTR